MIQKILAETEAEALEYAELAANKSMVEVKRKVNEKANEVYKQAYDLYTHKAQ